MEAAGAGEVRDELALDAQRTRLRKQGGVHPAADHVRVRLRLALRLPLSRGVALRLSRRLRGDLALDVGARHVQLES